MGGRCSVKGCCENIKKEKENIYDFNDNKEEHETEIKDVKVPKIKEKDKDKDKNQNKDKDGSKSSEAEAGKGNKNSIPNKKPIKANNKSVFDVDNNYGNYNGNPSHTSKKHSGGTILSNITFVLI